MEKETSLSISQMAALHKITRQTLIYYDKIGLFKPAHTAENGYRMYSVRQIPFLREICYLKSIGVKLDDIRDHIGRRDPESALALLYGQEERLTGQIRKLTETRELLRRRIELYQNAQEGEKQVLIPEIRRLEARSAVFLPWRGAPCRETLHLTVMDLWKQALPGGPMQRFGSLLKQDAILTGSPLAGAGCYMLVPGHGDLEFPAGDYACMYKYGMPYETECLVILLRWIAENEYEIAGDAVDACLLDTTFYRAEHSADLCCLQIPVKKLAPSP